MGHSRSKMFDVMSITKAVIGLLCESKREDLLNMVGYSEDWDYDDFRKQVEHGADLKAYAKSKMKRDVQGFSYCNLAYQILACEQPDIASRFGKFIGRPVTRTTSRWVYGDGWKWEHCCGQPLGPHGLHMTKEVGRIFGTKAQQTLQQANPVPIEKGRWGGCGQDAMKGYWHGWFFKENAAFAIGYVSQIIAVTPERVSVQFYRENWSKPNEAGCDFVFLKF